MNMRIDIGIDGGGSGSRLLVQSGTRQAEVTGGPANVVTDPEGALANLTTLLAKGLAALELPSEALREARICAGLAGCRLPGQADAMAMAMPVLAYVVDDSVTALEGAFGGGDGTLASLGTGSFFIRKDGARVHHIGGWGFHLGDEGSGAWLGRRALSLALQVAEGRLPADPLADRLIAATPPHPVLWAREASPGDFAELARLVAGSDTALGAQLLAETTAALRSGLHDVGHDGGPLVLTGGLGRLLAPHLSLDLRAALGRPLDGALHLAKSLP